MTIRAFDWITGVLSWGWRSFGMRVPIFRRAAEYIAHAPLPFGLSSPFGTLYGWTMHEKLHPPEQETIAFFKARLNAGDTIADVGANIGYYTLLFSHLVGETGTVVSFEPSPLACTYLRRATRTKHNVRIENVGAFSRRATLSLSTTRGADPMGSLMYHRGPYATDVEVIPLREYPKSFDWIKVDAEGAEIEVLKGLKTPTRGVLEVARGIIETYGGGLSHFFSEIEALDYDIYFITHGGNLTLYRNNDLSPLVNNIYIEPRGRS